MDQLIHAFGIDAKLIVVQIINFALLLAALSYFLYKPVLKVLKDREDKIAQGIKDAEAAAVAKSGAEAEKQQIVAAANTEAEAMVSKAADHASAKADKITDEATQKAAAILASAEEAGKQKAEQLQKEAEAEMAQVAILAAEKILRQQS